MKSHTPFCEGSLQSTKLCLYFPRLKVYFSLVCNEQTQRTLFFIPKTLHSVPKVLTGPWDLEYTSIARNAQVWSSETLSKFLISVQSARKSWISPFESGIPMDLRWVYDTGAKGSWHSPSALGSCESYVIQTRKDLALKTTGNFKVFWVKGT